jgi:hypothetical protein
MTSQAAVFRVKQFPVKQEAIARGCGVDWSTAEMEKAVRWRRAKYTTTWIAGQLGRSPQAVRLKLHRLGVVVEPHRPAHQRRQARISQ